MTFHARAIPAALLIAVLAGGVRPALAQPAEDAAVTEWTGTAEQKIWGLMTVWAGAKYAFPWFDRRPDLDWDASAREFLPRVTAAPDLESYYDLLAELVTRLQDSHTSVLPPWGHFTPGYDYPPVEIRVVDGRFLVVAAGDAEQIAAANVYPGLEILSIDGVPIGQYFEKNVLRTHTEGSRHADEALLPFYLLYGPEGEPVRLTVGDADGTERAVVLTRSSAGRGGKPFLPRFLTNMMATALPSRALDGGILYVAVPTFENPDLANRFLELIDTVDPGKTKGLIIDLRNNMGGSSATCNTMVAALIDESAFSPVMSYPQYSAAEEAWGHEPRWSTKQSEIAPRDGARFTGPLVLLTDAITHSSAEDFVIELRAARRARVVGQRTAGGAGNSLRFPLPGGGEFQVSTFRATCPDGTEYVGIGLAPDYSVAPTREDILAGNDPVLEKALDLLREP